MPHEETQATRSARLTFAYIQLFHAFRHTLMSDCDTEATETLRAARQAIVNDMNSGELVIAQALELALYEGWTLHEPKPETHGAYLRNLRETVQSSMAVSR